MVLQAGPVLASMRGQSLRHALPGASLLQFDCCCSPSPLRPQHCMTEGRVVQLLHRCFQTHTTSILLTVLRAETLPEFARWACSDSAGTASVPGHVADSSLHQRIAGRSRRHTAAAVRALRSGGPRGAGCAQEPVSGCGRR